MSYVMRAKAVGENGEGGFVKAKFEGPKRLNDVAHLLRDAVFEYARFNYNFRSHSNEPDFPFGWGELQNQGIMFRSFCHALRNWNYQELALPERPYLLNKYQYKRRKRPENHRIDLWVSLRGKQDEKETVLLVEYKHKQAGVKKRYVRGHWRCEHDKPLRKTDVRLWEQDWRKLNEATKRQYRNDFTNSVRSDIAKMIFMTLVVHNESINKELDVEPVNREDFAFHTEDIELRPTPNWRGWWWLPGGEQRKPTTWDDKWGCHYLYYRGLYFLARLELVPK